MSDDPGSTATPVAVPPCPRHPAVPADLTCARCGDFLCRECARPAGEPPLPHCEECLCRLGATPRALPAGLPWSAGDAAAQGIASGVRFFFPGILAHLVPIPFAWGFAALVLSAAVTTGGGAGSGARRAFVALFATLLVFGIAAGWTLVALRVRAALQVRVAAFVTGRAPGWTRAFAESKGAVGALALVEAARLVLVVGAWVPLLTLEAVVPAGRSRGWILALGALAGAVASAYVLIRLSAASACAVLERRGGREALARSWKLVRPCALEIGGIGLGLGFVLVFGAALVGGLLQAVVGGGNFVGVFLGLAGPALVDHFTTTFGARLYLGLRGHEDQQARRFERRPP